jgi:hypothetical protein
MTKIEFHEALTMANGRIEAYEKQSRHNLAIIESATIFLGRGWVFFYNTKEFIETMDIVHALGGNCPIYVADDGSLFELPTHIPWEEGIKALGGT